MHRLQIMFVAVAILFASCEGAISTEGYVYDNQTKQPLENVRVILILDDKDTVERDRPINLNNIDLTDSSKYKPSYTDGRGHFSG